VDLGVTESLAVNGTVVDMPEAPGRSGRYIQGGLRYYLGDTISSLQLYGSGHGWLAEAGIKARIGTYALELTHTQRQSDFVSSVYNTAGSGLKMRDALRLTGGLRVPGLPMVSLSVEGHRDANWSGQVEAAMSGRASTMVLGTSLSNTLRWSYSAVYRGVDGSFQLSRRIMNVGVSAQMDYAVRPNPQVHALSLTADRTLGSGFRINGGIVHTPEASQTIVSGAVSKNMGAYSVAVSGSYSSEHETVLGMQLFMALGKDPRKGQWMADSQPMAGAGAVSARAFLDKNSNGVRDADEQLIAGAAFVINRGGRYPVRTDANGTVFMSRLPTGQYVDVALDAGTLEDPQWTSSVPGWRVLSRPGRVELLEFPVVPCSEIEGTVYLLHKGARRPIGDTRLEMLDEHQRVVARTTSSGDGYFLMHQVPPGRLVLRVDPEQAAKLNLQGNLQREIVAPPEGDFISGQDIELVKP
jgi:hypothetical protein